MAQKFVGIDLGNRKVKVAVVNAGLRGAQVMHVWEQEVRASRSREPSEDAEASSDLDAAIDTALRILKERGVAHLPTGVALPGGAGSYRVLNFPFDDVRQIAQAINFELDGQFPVPIDELATDHMPIKRGDGRGRALVVAVKRTVLEHVSARLQLADVDLKVVTTGALAIAQALSDTPVAALPPGASPDHIPVSLIVDYGYKSTELVAVSESGPMAARSMRRGGRQLVRALEKAWRLDEAAASVALERDGNLEDPTIQRALQPLVREIEHTRAWLKSEFGCVVTELRLSGGIARLAGFDRWLAAQTGLTVASVQPKESGALRDVQGRDWTRNLVALGTALATGRRPLIQLHDAFDGGGGEGAWFQQHFSTVAALGVAIVAFAGVDSYVRVKAAERERDAYAAELADETLAVFGEKLSTGAAVQTKLTEVEGGEIQSFVFERGALEILELITKAATPKGGRVIAEAPPELPPGYTTSIGPDGTMMILGPDGAPTTTDPMGNPLIPPQAPPPSGGEDGEDGEDGGGEAVAAALPPVADIKAGILNDDDLQFRVVEIRERKIELSLTAMRGSAQDRLGYKLEQYACISDAKNGKVSQRQDRQAFDMSVDHNCFLGSVAIQGNDTSEETSEDDGEG